MEDLIYLLYANETTCTHSYGLSGEHVGDNHTITIMYSRLLYYCRRTVIVEFRCRPTDSHNYDYNYANELALFQISITVLKLER